MASSCLKGSDNIKQQFRLCDLDDSGTIDLDEMCAVLQVLDADLWTKENVRDVFVSMDRNSDGKIQYEEFVDWIFDNAGDSEPTFFVPAEIRRLKQSPLARKNAEDGEREGETESKWKEEEKVEDAREGEEEEHEEDGDDGEIETASNDWLRAGAYTARGARATNEDQHLMLCNWSPVEGVRAGLFAVLDGHGGYAVSILASRLLAKQLRTEMQAASSDGSTCWNSQAGRQEAVERAFMTVDRTLSSKDVAKACGSTCVAAILWKASEGEADDASYRVLIANLGDSRGLVVLGSRVGSACEGSLLVETSDHKPDRPDEEARIDNAGGLVTGTRKGPMSCPRVDGDLAVSRAFGDFRLKDNEELPLEQQKVSPMPEIYELSCRHGDTLVLCCDGVWDVLKSKEVGMLVFDNLKSRSKLGRAEAIGEVAHYVVRTSLRKHSMDRTQQWQESGLRWI